MSFKIQTNCRACGWGPKPNPGGIKSAEDTQRLIPVLDLGIQPLANAFRKQGESNPGFYPLALNFCPQCNLAQLSVVVDPHILYDKYAYVTSPGPTMREHFGALLRDIATEQAPGSVVEIGSNDGLFLAFLHDNGYGNVVGIDPAQNLAENAKRAGLHIVNDFFNPESARVARNGTGDVDLVIARHVFCHVNDWQDFVRGLDVLAGKNTLICIEVPCVADQIEAGSFDQVYHEHLSYLPISAMKALLNGAVFHLHRIIHYPVHGGASLIMIRRNDSEIPPHPSVLQTLDSENVNLVRWKRFADEAQLRIIALRNKVTELRAQGKRVCGYGASAKSTVWINACGFTKDDIYGVYDGTLEKLYCSIPGTNIPVIHEGAFYVDGPDYAINFSWNFRAEIEAKQKKWFESGGKWIVPVPKLEVIGLDSGA